MGNVDKVNRTLALNEMMYHVRRDAALRRRFVDDLDGLGREFGLSVAEVEALRDRDVRKLSDLGVHQIVGDIKPMLGHHTPRRTASSFVRWATTAPRGGDTGADTSSSRRDRGAGDDKWVMRHPVQLPPAPWLYAEVQAQVAAEGARIASALTGPRKLGA